MNKLPYISKASDLGIALTLAATPAEARALLGVGSGGGGGGAVDSVNGQTGDVTLDAADVGAAPAGAPLSSFANDVGFITDADIPGSPVLSVNSQTGAVNLTAADVGAATTAQGAKADSALQPGDIPAQSVTSVNSKTGAVVLSAADVGAVPTTAVGSSVAPLVGGLLPNSYLPPLAITSTFVVSSQAAQLALAVQEGDVCIRTDLGKSYIRLNSSLGTMADWQELLTPTAPVQSVNGKTGVVSLTAADIGVVGFYVPGFISGLSLAWVDIHTVSVSGGTAHNQAADANYRQTAAANVTIPSTASTFFHIYQYGNNLLEVSTAAPTTPYVGTAASKSGDTSRRYLGSVVTDTSGNVVKFMHDGDEVMYTEGIARVLAGGAATAFTAVSLSAQVPAGTRTALLAMANGSATVAMRVRPVGYANSLNIRMYGISGAGYAAGPISLVGGLNVEYQVDANGSAHIDVLGYKLSR